jgi:molybdopterin-guanine dinucleotide biosynthesis protein A
MAPDRRPLPLPPPPAPTAVAGLLLTGGAARRLGAAKAGLRRDGETLGARAARQLRAVCSGPVLEVGPGETGLATVREEPKGAGPLAALAAGGASLRDRGHQGGALLLAVDLPLVDQVLLALIAGWAGHPTAVPEAAGRLQTVCARYGPDALAAAVALVARGERSLQALLAEVEHDVVPEAAWRVVAPIDVFHDVDTPADAASLGIALPQPGPRAEER